MHDSPTYRMAQYAANDSPSPGGEGRGEGERKKKSTEDVEEPKSQIRMLKSAGAGLI